MEWIEIKKNWQYPEFGIGVLIYLKPSGMITVGYRQKKTDGYYWQLFGDTEMIVHEDDQVTHWIPLPKAPQK